MNLGNTILRSLNLGSIKTLENYTDISEIALDPFGDVDRDKEKEKGSRQRELLRRLSVSGMSEHCTKGNYKPHLMCRMDRDEFGNDFGIKNNSKKKTKKLKRNNSLSHSMII